MSTIITKLRQRFHLTAPIRLNKMLSNLYCNGFTLIFFCKRITRISRPPQPQSIYPIAPKDDSLEAQCVARLS